MAVRRFVEFPSPFGAKGFTTSVTRVQKTASSTAIYTDFTTNELDYTLRSPDGQLLSPALAHHHARSAKTATPSTIRTPMAPPSGGREEAEGVALQFTSPSPEAAVPDPLTPRRAEDEAVAVGGVLPGPTSPPLALEAVAPVASPSAASPVPASPASHASSRPSAQRSQSGSVPAASPVAAVPLSPAATASQAEAAATPEQVEEVEEEEAPPATPSPPPVLFEGTLDEAFCDAYAATGTLLSVEMKEEVLGGMRPCDLAVLDALLTDMVEFQGQRLVKLLEEREVLKERVGEGRQLAAEHIKVTMAQRPPAPGSWW